MATKTYNQLVKLIEDISDNHGQVNSFGSGEIVDIENFINTTQNYPIIWLNLVSAEITDNTIRYRVNLLCIDILEKDKSNENDIWSDSIQILTDFVRILRVRYTDIDLTEYSEIFPFTERFSEYLSGGRIEMVIETDLVSGIDCYVPQK